MIELIILLSLLVLGYGFGSYREKAHYQSILQREDEFADITLFRSRFPPDATRTKGGEMVRGNVVISADYFKIFVAGLRKLFGGRLRTYETLLDRGRREAVLRMKEEARALGAEQIFNIKFETSSISQGGENTLGSIEVLVYGTALRRA